MAQYCHELYEWAELCWESDPALLGKEGNGWLGHLASSEITAWLEGVRWSKACKSQPDSVNLYVVSPSFSPEKERKVPRRRSVTWHFWISHFGRTAQDQIDLHF